MEFNRISRNKYPYGRAGDIQIRDQAPVILLYADTGYIFGLPLLLVCLLLFEQSTHRSKVSCSREHPVDRETFSKPAWLICSSRSEQFELENTWVVQSIF